jgi:hypothetical protein
VGFVIAAYLVAGALLVAYALSLVARQRLIAELSEAAGPPAPP